MKYKASEIIEYIEEWAKPIYQESWDNSGKQIFFNEVTENITIALDLTDEVIEEAVKNNSKLIITHHPMFFGDLKRIDENTYMGKNILKLVENRISVYSAHTSLDIAYDGVNDTLCELLGLKSLRGLSKTDSGYMIGKIGEFPEEVSLKEIVDILKTKLKYSGIKVYGKNIEYIKKTAVCGGSGCSMIDDVLNNNVKCYITGDVKHHDAQYAYENNLVLIDISHYYGERAVLDKIKKVIVKNFNINVSIVKNNSYEVSIENMGK